MTLSLSAAGLTKVYDGRAVVDGLDFAFQRGKVHAVIGPNGSGKSTLLRLLSLLDPPTRGTVLLHDGEDPVEAEHLRPPPDGLCVPAAELSSTRPSSRTSRRGSRSAAVRNGSGATSPAPPCARSRWRSSANGTAGRSPGGESQRVALARALVVEPNPRSSSLTSRRPTSTLIPSGSSEKRSRSFGTEGARRSSSSRNNMLPRPAPGRPGGFPVRWADRRRGRGLSRDRTAPGRADVPVPHGRAGGSPAENSNADSSFFKNIHRHPGTSCRYRSRLPPAGGPGGAGTQRTPGCLRIRCASTTSTQNSGLFGVLLPAFERKTGIKIDVIAVGTGQALKLGQRGDVDVVFVHSKEEELRLAAEGYFVDRRDVMYNDFILLGRRAITPAPRGRSPPQPRSRKSPPPGRRSSPGGMTPERTRRRSPLEGRRNRPEETDGIHGDRPGNGGRPPRGEREGRLHSRGPRHLARREGQKEPGAPRPPGGRPGPLQPVRRHGRQSLETSARPVQGDHGIHRMDRLVRRTEPDRGAQGQERQSSSFRNAGPSLSSPPPPIRANTRFAPYRIPPIHPSTHSPIHPFTRSPIPRFPDSPPFRPSPP